MSDTNVASEDCAQSKKLSLTEMSPKLKPRGDYLILFYSYQRVVGFPKKRRQREDMDSGKLKEKRPYIHG